MGHAENFFWSRRPVLPFVKSSGLTDVHLADWGNRENDIDLPKTGWVRWESFGEGEWNHLHPTKILIPAYRGCEKKVWFDIGDPIAGILAEKDGIVRAYMITLPANDEYRALTGHDRMPKIVKV